MGKGIRMGILQSAKGTLIHADLQTSYNIVKKAIPEAFTNWIGRYRVKPMDINPQADDNFQMSIITLLM